MIPINDPQLSMRPLVWLLISGACMCLVQAAGVGGTSLKAIERPIEPANATPVYERESAPAPSLGDNDDELNLDAFNEFIRTLRSAESEEEGVQHIKNVESNEVEKSEENEDNEVQKREAVGRRARTQNNWVRIGKRLFNFHKRLEKMLDDYNLKTHNDEKRAAKYVRIGRGRTRGSVKFVRIGRSLSPISSNIDNSLGDDSSLNEVDVNSFEKRSRASPKFVRIGRRKWASKAKTA